jgi:hypothetical protein
MFPGGVMVSLLTSSVVNDEFNLWLSQTKYYTIGTFIISASPQNTQHK